jgi:hypothetical protein
MGKVYEGQWLQRFLTVFYKAKKKNMCVYGHPTDPMNFYTEFG